MRWFIEILTYLLEYTSKFDRDHGSSYNKIFDES